MINFTLLTDTPARLRDFLISRGIMKLEDDGEGGQQLVGNRPGMEITEVPNPIVTDNSDPENPVHDTRRAFMVKMAYESESEKSDAFRDWVVSNSSVVTAPLNYTINGEPVGNARKVNGENVWLVHDNPERFGVWQ